MATVAARAPARPRPLSRPTLLSGILWIVALAALLGGIVALNVAVLQLNVRLERAEQAKEELRAANDSLSGRLSRAGSIPQVALTADRLLGLVPASPEETTYVDLGGGR